MSLNPISVNVDPAKKTNPSFGNGNMIVSVMDAVDRGGYIASFVAQDFCGFVIPRVTTGLNRNREETGELNWKFASTEATRELLSGPSMVAIPALILYAVKKKFGKAHDVPITYISAIGNHFEDFASRQSAGTVLNKDLMKKGFYKETVRNILENATNGELKAGELDEKVKYYSDKLLEIEKAPKKSGFKIFLNKKMPGSSHDMLGELAGEFIDLRKQYSGAMVNSRNVEYTILDKNGNKTKVSKEFTKFFEHVRNYTDDVTDTITSKFKGSSVKEFIKGFNQKRAGSRFALTFGMTAAVAAFLTIVPKLYKHKDGNPGLAGLVHDEQNSEPVIAEKDKISFSGNSTTSADSAQPATATQPSFGSAGSLGKKLMEGGGLRKFANEIEYNGFSMSSASLLSLFYFGVVGPRYIQAYDKYDKAEILRRDLISLTALTFLAQALGKGFSQISQKTSGFVLSHRPENFNKIAKKVWNFIYPESEFQTLKSPDIIAKYSGIDKFKNGIVDFCEFINKNGGDSKKVLSYDKGVKANVEKILGKSIKDASFEEMIESFKKAKGSEALDNIYKTFSKPDNVFVKRAKTMNNTFGFIATFLLTPALIIWIAKSNEKMTKDRIQKEQAQKTAEKITKQYFK